MKKVLSYLGTAGIMAFHGYVILEDGIFDIPVAGQFVVLHFIWFEICEGQIQKAVAAIR